MIKLKYNKPTLFEDLRYENRLTGKQFAAKIELTPGAYHHLEQGNTWPSFGTVLKTMEVFNVSIERFREYYVERARYIEENNIKPYRGANSQA